MPKSPHFDWTGFMLSKFDKALVVAPDDTVYYVDIPSGKVIWSFSFSPSRYSSIPNGNKNIFYIDCGDDWELSVHGTNLKKIVCMQNGRSLASRLQDVFQGDRVLSFSSPVHNLFYDPKNEVLHFHSSNKSEEMLALPTSSGQYTNRSILIEGPPQMISRNVESEGSMYTCFIYMFLVCGVLFFVVLVLYKTFGKPSKETHLDDTHKTLGRKIGHITIFDKRIGGGNNGTIVCEGFHDDRPAAVKKMVKGFCDLAEIEKEMKILKEAYQDRNIVHYFGYEENEDFVFIAMERCDCNLEDLIKSSGCVGTNKKLELWENNTYPSAVLKEILRDIVKGVSYLHKHDIIHLDLKPQNVLILADDQLTTAKIADMGISKYLDKDKSSLGQNCTGCGTLGWQAPEQLISGKPRRPALDLFSLGGIFFYCLTKGNHAFGNDSTHHNANILSGKNELFLLDHIPEATHLVSGLLETDPNKRPKVAEVLAHPLFWDSNMRPSFLRTASDRFAKEYPPSLLLSALEKTRVIVFKKHGRWDSKLDSEIQKDVQYWNMKTYLVRDLLRYIRNNSGHHQTIKAEVSAILRSHPVGFDNYFSSHFPHLLIEVYKIIRSYCKKEEAFEIYFEKER